MMPGFFFILFLFIIICILISKKKKTHDSYPNHEFELKNNPKAYWCNGCRLPAYGPRYSSCDESDIDLHEKCFPTPTTSHNMICEGLTFKFFDKPPKSSARNRKRYCDACGQAINGFVYHCKEKNWYLHPFCRDLEKTIVIKDVKFRLCAEVSQECEWCKKRELSNDVKRSWSYLNKGSKRLFHVYCVTKLVLESWKIAPKDSNHLDLENLDLPLPDTLPPSPRRRGKGRKFLRITVKFLGTILIPILFGDPTIPTIALGSLFVGLVEQGSK